MNNILLVPGLYDSGPQHWQTLWHQQHPHWLRIAQSDWITPDLHRWAAPVLELLQNSQTPLTLVAHSFGCLASLYAARQMPEKVHSLFLVAPADPDLLGVQEALINHPTPVAGRIIASSNDPWMPLDRVCFWSQRWGLPLSLLGPLRHINTESGHGAWPEGLALLGWHCQLQDKAVNG
jgi:Predicted esterase of the alpha/beta hydrolase fold